MSLEALTWDREIEIGAVINLRASRCQSCDRVEFPAVPRCPSCAGPADDIALASEAELGPVTEVLHAPPGALVTVPYVVGVARFPEGISILGLVLATDIDHMADGDRVETVAHRPSPDLQTYAYRPM